MALVFRGATPCAICGVTLQKDDEIFATSAGPIPSTDALWQYQDSGMHRDCFLSWDLRESFRRKFNDYYDRHLRGMRFMREDGSIEERDPRSGAV